MGQGVRCASAGLTGPAAIEYEFPGTTTSHSSGGRVLNTAAPTGVRGGFHVAFRVAMALMVVGVLAQVYLAGLGLFGTEGFGTHEDFGWIVHTIGMVAVVLAIIGPRSKVTILGALGLFVLNTAQIQLSQADAAGLAALHPTLALAVLGLAGWLVFVTGTRAASA
jgi:hypothetical protein